MLDSGDREALVMALERCEPQQVADWIIALACNQFEPVDDVAFSYEENDDWRASSCYPVAFDAWWRENRRAPDEPHLRLAPLPKQKYRRVR